MKRAGLAALIVFTASLFGCQSKEAALTGVWKVFPVEAKNKQSLNDVAKASMISLFANSSLEFDGKGSFKAVAPMFPGNATGTYVWEGDVVVLTWNSLAPQQPLRLKLADGNSALVEDTKFESDVGLRFEKAK